MKINIEDEIIELRPEVWKDEAALKDDIKGKIDLGDYNVVKNPWPCVSSPLPWKDTPRSN